MSRMFFLCGAPLPRTLPCELLPLGIPTLLALVPRFRETASFLLGSVLLHHSLELSGCGQLGQ